MKAQDPLDTWREQLRRGGLELAILLAVSSTQRYGLEIIRYLQDSTDLVVAEGTIYPILALLTRNRLVEAEWNAEEASHPRKYYRLTTAGRKTLDEMLEHWTSFRQRIDRLVETEKGKGRQR